MGTKPDVRQNAGRCDWCGEIVEMDSGDDLIITTEEELGNEEHDVSAEDAADAIARALEHIGNSPDKMMAELIRKNLGYRVHKRCFEESSLPQLYVDEGSSENAQDRPFSSTGDSE